VAIEGVFDFDIGETNESEILFIQDAGGGIGVRGNDPCIIGRHKMLEDIKIDFLQKRRCVSIAKSDNDDPAVAGIDLIKHLGASSRIITE